MKVSKKWMALLALPVFSVAMAAEKNVAPVPAPAPGAKQIQNAPKTMEEALKFLPETVMVVNGKKIEKKQIIEKMKAIIPEQFIGQVPPAQLKQMVNGMLDLEILGALADKAGYKPSEARVKKMLMDQLSKLTPEQKAELEARMKAANKTIESFVSERAKNPEAQKELAFYAWVLEKIAPTVKVSDGEVLDYYNANKANYISPESITTSHILIQPKNPGEAASEKEAAGKAKAILAQIRQGVDFGKLAEIESACPSGKISKGFLGKKTKEEIKDQDFWKAAFAMKKGQISDVVKTRFGYHIIRLDDKTEAVAAKLADVKDAIVRDLTDKKTNEKLVEAVGTAKKNGFAKVSKF